MSKTTSTKNPEVERPYKNWVINEIMKTKRRIEKAFHKQTQFLTQKYDDLKREFVDIIGG